MMRLKEASGRAEPEMAQASSLKPPASGNQAAFDAVRGRRSRALVREALENFRRFARFEVLRLVPVAPTQPRSGALAIRGLASGLAPGKLEASNLQVEAALEPGLCGFAAALSLRLEGS